MKINKWINKKRYAVLRSRKVRKLVVHQNATARTKTTIALSKKCVCVYICFWVVCCLYTQIYQRVRVSTKHVARFSTREKYVYFRVFKPSHWMLRSHKYVKYLNFMRWQHCNKCDSLKIGARNKRKIKEKGRATTWKKVVFLGVNKSIL